MAITRVRVGRGKGWKASYGGKTKVFKTEAAAKRWAADPKSVVRKSDQMLLARRKEKARDPTLNPKVLVGRETGVASRKKSQKKKTRARGSMKVY